MSPWFSEQVGGEGIVATLPHRAGLIRHGFARAAHVGVAGYFGCVLGNRLGRTTHFLAVYCMQLCVRSALGLSARTCSAATLHRCLVQFLLTSCVSQLTHEVFDRLSQVAAPCNLHFRLVMSCVIPSAVAVQLQLPLSLIQASPLGHGCVRPRPPTAQPGPLRARRRRPCVENVVVQWQGPAALPQAEAVAGVVPAAGAARPRHRRPLLHDQASPACR